MNDVMFMLHLLGMAAGVGTGFVMARLSAAAAELAPEERLTFMKRASAAGMVSTIGLIVLILTGIYLVIPLWSSVASAWTFMAKLTAVVLLIVFFGLLHVKLARARREGTPEAWMAVGKVSPIVTILGVLVVVFAVLTFH